MSQVIISEQVNDERSDHSIAEAVQSEPNGSDNPEMIRQGFSLARKGGRVNNGVSNPTRTGGRLPSITEQKLELILIGLRKGYPLPLAFSHAGIRRDRFTVWMRHAYKALERENKGIRKSKRDKELIQLLELFELNESKSEVAMVNVIVGAAQRGSWAAALSLLERRHPERWAKSEERETNINVTVGYQSIQIASNTLTDTSPQPRSDNQLPGAPIPESRQLTDGDHSDR